MMTAKEYVEVKVKSYTRLAERCKREAEASDDIVVRAGYSARANSFASASSHSRNGRRRARKYIFEKERIRRDEVDSLPPIRRKKEEPARAPTRTSPKGDEFRRPSPQK